MIFGIPCKINYAAWCGWLAIGAGVAVLGGWLFGIEHVKAVVPGFVAMNPLTAVCFIVAGTSLWWQRELCESARDVVVARGLALILLTVGTLKICDYMFGLRLGIDQLLFSESLVRNSMAPNTALCFMLTGLSLLCLDWNTARGSWLAQIPAVLLAIFGLISLIGYAYGASGLYRVPSHIPMALNTAFVFQVVSLGLLLSRPNRGIASILLHPGLGGMMARRLVPMGIAVPCLLGWLQMIGQRAEWYDTELGAAIMVVIAVVVFTAAICWIAAVLNRTDTQNQAGALQLEQRNKQIRDLYDHAPCGYHSLDANGTFIAINQTELDWLGYSKDEVLGKLKYTDVTTEDGQRKFAENFPKLKLNGEVKDLEFDLVSKDGRTRPVTISATAITDADGNFVASRSTLFDATERRRVEQTIRSFNAELEKRVADRTAQLKVVNAELEEKNQENKMFVYSVSHDLRSPLINLQGFSQELASVSHQVRDTLTAAQMPSEVKSQATRLIDDDMQRCIRFIQTSVGRLSGIIESLLRLSRAGRVELNPQNVDLNQTVDRVVEAMSSVAYEQGVKIEVRPLPHVWADPTAVEQIFANLIGNAVNYLDPKRPGQIEVGSLATDNNRDSITYFVKDNGQGISRADQDKVFRPLNRLHPGAARGEGIGLAFVKRMVERHGGTIRFESTAGIGTTFFVELSRAKPGTLAPVGPVIFPSQAGSHHAIPTP